MYGSALISLVITYWFLSIEFGLPVNAKDKELFILKNLFWVRHTCTAKISMQLSNNIKSYVKLRLRLIRDLTLVNVRLSNSLIFNYYTYSGTAGLV